MFKKHLVHAYWTHRHNWLCAFQGPFDNKNAEPLFQKIIKNFKMITAVWALLSTGPHVTAQVSLL